MRNLLFKRIITPSLCAFVALLFCVTPLLAYTYYGLITASEGNGTSYGMVGMTASVNNTLLVSEGYITSTGLDTAVKDSGDNTVPHMLTTDKVLFADSITGSQSSVYTYEMGNDPISSFDIITGYDGYITTADAAALEPANDFEVEISGYFDTSAADKYILKKDGALELYTSDVGEITGKIWTGTTASVEGGGISLYSNIYGANWAMQSFTSLGEYCPSVKIYTQKYADPSGNFVIGLYATSGGNPTGSALATSTITATSVTAGGYYTGTFTAPVQLTNGVVYAIVMNCVSGDAGNYIKAAYLQTGNTYAGGQAKTSSNSGSTWSNLNYDFYFAVNNLGSKTVVGTGITSGEHIIKLTADGTNLKLFDGVTEKDSEALSGASVTNNANNFVWLDDNSVPYADYIKYTVSDTLLITYQPVAIISGTTLPDTTGTAQNGTITFGANPDGLTSSIGSLQSGGSSYTSPDSTASSQNVVPGTTGTLSSSTGVTDSPFYPFFSAIYTASGNKLGVDLQAIMFAIIFTIGFGLMGGVVSQGRSFFLVVAGLGVGAGIGYALDFYQDVWILYVIIVLAIAALLLDAKKGW